MKKNSLFVKIMAGALAVLMVGSVAATLITILVSL